MSPIEDLATYNRPPRLGKIRLGIKKQKLNEKQEVVAEYPSATDYFVCTPELLKAMGLPEDAKPTELEVMFPVEDDEVVAQQYYRRYSYNRLICIGTGRTCSQLTDEETGDAANKDSKKVKWVKDLTCTGKKCPLYIAKKCTEVMNLKFVLPTCKGIGIWEIDTGSINSMLNINATFAYLRRIYGRISMIPLVLALVETNVTNPDDGKRKRVHVLLLTAKFSMLELAAAAGKTMGAFLLPAAIRPVAAEEDDEEEAGPPEDLMSDEEEIDAAAKRLKEAPVAANPPSSASTEGNKAQGTASGAATGTASSGQTDDIAFSEPEKVEPTSAVYREATGKDELGMATPEQINRLKNLVLENKVLVTDLAQFMKLIWHTTRGSELTKIQAGSLIDLIESGTFLEALSKAQKADELLTKAPGTANPPTKALETVAPPAAAPAVHEPLITAAQLKRLKELRDTYQVNVSMAIKKQKVTVDAVNKLPEKVAAAVIEDIEKALKAKGVL